MAKLTAQQIAGAAKAAGFPDNELATATAVALAESGGETTATNRNTNGSVDYGLWQINTVHGSLLSQGDKFNPTDNAKMAYTVWNGAGRKWSPWSAYNNQRYRTFLPTASLAAAAPTATPASASIPNVSPGGAAMAAGDAVVGAAGGTADILSLLSGLTSGGLWTRLGAFLLGGILVLFSLWKLTGAGDIIVQTGKVAAKVASKGVV
jgi:hypothetical protein